MAPDLFARVEAAAAFVRERAPVQPRIGLILGSGLDETANSGLQLRALAALPYAEIPHFPRATAPGHRGALLLGTVAGVPVAVMLGRVHGYEGHTPEQVTFPVRVLARLGAGLLVVTNAAGGIREALRPGDLVLIADHINFTGTNPLTGANEDRFGPRFFDMTEAYSPRLRALAHKAAHAEGDALAEGVYLGLTGPSYETPAEIRAFRAWGADLVGMSTVHEVITARHMGMEVLGISCVTNMAAGVLPEPIDHAEVFETGRRAASRLGGLLFRLIQELRGDAGRTA